MGCASFFLIENIILTPSASLVPLKQGDNNKNIILTPSALLVPLKQGDNNWCVFCLIFYVIFWCDLGVVYME